MLGKSIAIGQFIPIESPVHRLDPRVKILVSAILIVALFIVKEWLSFLFIGCFIILLTITARIPISYIGKSLKPILFLLAFTLVLQVFFYPWRLYLGVWFSSCFQRGAHPRVVYHCSSTLSFNFMHRSFNPYHFAS
jgi:energy-coupling factor transporter transmembrane protein EcfT